MTTTPRALAAITSACAISLAMYTLAAACCRTLAPSPARIATDLTKQHSCALERLDSSTETPSARRRCFTCSSSLSLSTSADRGSARSASSILPSPAPSTSPCGRIGVTAPGASDRAIQSVMPPGALAHALWIECTAIELAAHRSAIRPVTSSAERMRSGLLGVGEYVMMWLACPLIASAITCSVRSTHSMTTAAAPRSTSRSVLMVSPTLSPLLATCGGKRRANEVSMSF
mmetsp:Transcript_6697/g.17518  ORF Transcript_6697/g.17518 Transcript_6697/m.17518 type:complete len:231 (-) Transcript_6697:68-760(-)